MLGVWECHGSSIWNAVIVVARLVSIPFWWGGWNRALVQSWELWVTSVLSCSVSYWFEWCVVFWTSDTFLLALGASSSRWSGGGAMPLIVSSQDVYFACVEHCMPILEYSAGADVQSTACGAPQEFLASFPITEFRLLSFWTFFLFFFFWAQVLGTLGAFMGGVLVACICSARLACWFLSW